MNRGLSRAALLGSAGRLPTHSSSSGGCDIFGRVSREVGRRGYARSGRKHRAAAAGASNNPLLSDMYNQLDWRTSREGSQGLWTGDLHAWDESHARRVEAFGKRAGKIYTSLSGEEARKIYMLNSNDLVGLRSVAKGEQQQGALRRLAYCAAHPGRSMLVHTGRGLQGSTRAAAGPSRGSRSGSTGTRTRGAAVAAACGSTGQTQRDDRPV